MGMDMDMEMDKNMDMNKYMDMDKNMVTDFVSCVGDRIGIRSYLLKSSVVWMQYKYVGFCISFDLSFFKESSHRYENYWESAAIMVFAKIMYGGIRTL